MTTIIDKAKFQNFLDNNGLDTISLSAYHRAYLTEEEAYNELGYFNALYANLKDEAGVEVNFKIFTDEDLAKCTKAGLLIAGQSRGLGWCPIFKVWSLDGAAVPFKTEWTICNPKTGAVRTYRFAEATGSEWNPKTLWIYVDEQGLEIQMSNHIAQGAADNYLQAKTSW